MPRRTWLADCTPAAVKHRAGGETSTKDVRPLACAIAYASAGQRPRRLGAPFRT
jgi:hypothetical protein